MTQSARTTLLERRLAFTLLEVLLAVTVLGLITVLIAAMNAQLRDWTESSDESGESVRIQRAVELMRDQWAARVRVAGGRGASEELMTDPSYLSFVTSRPVLDPSFPIVRATYRLVPIDPDDESTRYDLVYEESPVGRVGPKKEEKQTDNQQVPRDEPQRDEERMKRDGPERREVLKSRIEDAERTWPLIRGCEALSWERFGQGAIVLRNESAERRDEAPTPEYSLASEEQLREQRLFTWREYDEKLPVNARAMRLVGERGKEPFTCVFVIAASR